MAKIDLRIYPDAEALYAAATEALTRELQTVLRRKPKATFVLTGGNSARGVYEYMGPSCDFQDWNRVEFFWGDERCVPPDDEQSNYHLAHEAFLSRLSVSERQIHRMQAELKDHERVALLYEEEIRRNFPGQAPPNFDLLHLGMGEDGHTASLFPGTHWDEQRLVIVNYSPQHPFQRISMTLQLLNAARRVFFVVSGAPKAPALKRMVEDPTCDYPARRVQPASGQLTWMVDRAAASLLK